MQNWSSLLTNCHSATAYVDSLNQCNNSSGSSSPLVCHYAAGLSRNKNYSGGQSSTGSSGPTSLQDHPVHKTPAAVRAAHSSEKMSVSATYFPAPPDPPVSSMLAMSGGVHPGLVTSPYSAARFEQYNVDPGTFEAVTDPYGTHLRTTTGYSSYPVFLNQGLLDTSPQYTPHGTTTPKDLNQNIHSAEYSTSTYLPQSIDYSQAYAPFNSAHRHAQFSPYDTEGIGHLKEEPSLNPSGVPMSLLNYSQHHMTDSGLAPTHNHIYNRNSVISPCNSRLARCNPLLAGHMTADVNHLASLSVAQRANGSLPEHELSSYKDSKDKRPCDVCGDVSAGFHCNAFVCEACKKFFIRSSKSDNFTKYSCTKSRTCEIVKDTRTHCQCCRFQKCLHLGMHLPGTTQAPGADISLIPCRVCGATSSGFHFGAITCEGCKGFFRRTINERDNQKYTCSKGGHCPINVTTRNNCKSCRYDKCLFVGMSKDGSRIGRQPNAVKHMCAKEIEKILTSQSNHLHPHSAGPGPHPAYSRSHHLVPSSYTSSHSPGVYTPCATITSTNPAVSSSGQSIYFSHLTAGDNSVFSSGGPPPPYNVCLSTEGRHLPQLQSSSTPNITNSTTPTSGVDKDRNLPTGSVVVDLDSREDSRTLAPSRPPTSGDNYDVMQRMVGGHESRIPPSSISFQDNYSPYTTGKNNGTNHSPPHPDDSFIQHEISNKRRRISEPDSVEMSNLLAHPSSTDTLDIQGPDSSTDMTATSEYPPPRTDYMPPDLTVPFHNDMSIENFLKYISDASKHLCHCRRRDVDSSPVTAELPSPELWKCMMLHFQAHAKQVIQFANAVPGFKGLPKEDRKTLVQEAMYPIILVQLSRDFNPVTQEFNYFNFSKSELKIILWDFNSFEAIANHLKVSGEKMKRFNLDDTETALICCIELLKGDKSIIDKDGVTSIYQYTIKTLLDYTRCNSQDKSRGEAIMSIFPMLSKMNREHQSIVVEMKATRPYLLFPDLYLEMFQLDAAHSKASRSTDSRGRTSPST